MGKTNIDWADWVDNPVWGCLNTCPYCYARQMARRMGKTEDQRSFVPTWMNRNYSKAYPDKPQFVFINSMSDIAFWKDTWIELTLKKITEFPQHTYFFLTKNPECYSRFLLFPSNCWFGVSITDQAAMNRFADLFYDVESHWKIWGRRKIFFSVEPLLTNIELSVAPNWLIIGAETGRRKGKVIPQFHWIGGIINECDISDVPVWMKDSLKGVYRGDLIQDRPEVE